MVGGWMADTRRAVIEDESAVILQREDIKALVDVDKLAVYGPRRSVGMLKFVQREGESCTEDVRSRMSKVVKILAQEKYILPSTQSSGDDKAMWAAFMKTKAARSRTAHISMLRRVCIALATETKDEAGAVLRLEHTEAGAYDMDWSAGTIWCGIHKLGSATHRSPKPQQAEVILMGNGWVNLDAVALVAGCSPDTAKRAFELEL